MNEPCDDGKLVQATSIKVKPGPTSPLKQIRRLCLDCADGPKSVRFCQGTDCPLWPFRFGKRPTRVIREMGRDALNLFDPAWILQRREEDE